jgi:hypothetical protein
MNGSYLVIAFRQTGTITDLFRQRQCLAGKIKCPVIVTLQFMEQPYLTVDP